ncbi:MAG: hypothetical protein IJQ68_01625 [Methanobrevibacter sp.]|uniref:hypothetical protein n=1 Tax=Methanobrevibacter sp. TaxID=66852 RepID=UPI0025F36E21|nr:hypothetical protein [Methanobrevibacter sp.]MBR0270680.1 hypothetical protein [Methanobrevibacter sp.]
MKKIFLVLAVFLFSLSFIWAGENIKYYENDTLIEYDSVNFTIPHGYGQDNSTLNDTTIFFVNEKNETINITVGSKMIDGNYTMFGSHTGYLNQTNSTVSFSYVVEDKNVTVSALSQQTLLKVLEG